MGCSGMAQPDFAILGSTIKQDRKPKEQKMTKIITNRTFTAAAFGVAALFSIISFGSSAQASSVLSCYGATANQAVACCDRMVEKKGMPLWMMQSGASCHTAVKCKGDGKCYILVWDYTREGGGKQGIGGRGQESKLR
jgi:hypothetical protein